MKAVALIIGGLFTSFACDYVTETRLEHWTLLAIVGVAVLCTLSGFRHD